MTLTEAKAQWNVSHQRLCEWLDAGIIPDVSIVDGKVHIPDIQPFVPPKGTKITVDKVRNYILKACMNLQYIDYRILTIEPEQFRAILVQLEESGYISCDFPEADCLSNKHFITTESGEKALKKKKLNLQKLAFELGASYCGVSAKVGAEFEKER